MSANLTPFKFGASEIRIAHHEGECVWIAKDVSDALGYTWNGTARIKHVPDEWRGVTSVVTPSGEQEMAYLTEAGLFFFLNRSDKPAALPLQKWVAGEVLPSIRKTGGYIAAATEETPEQIMARAIMVAQETISRQKSEKDQIEAARAAAQARVEELEPKAEAHDHLAEQDGDLGVRDAGRELRIGQKWVTEYIDGHGWSCIEGGKRKPAHYGLKMGYCRLVPEDYRHPHTGEEKVREAFRLTRKGIGRLAEIIVEMRKKNGLPTVPFVPTPEPAS